jgi:cation transport ATPase
METLIALGSLSAISLWIMFLIKYGWDILSGEGVKDVGEAVMDINDALTSASIIVLVVTIGKHFEQKVKNKIEAMTEQIFPESTLFANMKVELIELQNRKLKIKGRKQCDFTLLEKDDIISINSLTGLRLLVDVIVISGNSRGMQGTTTGCDEVVPFAKGDRIESGAVIYPPESEDQDECLAIVENVF